MMKTFKHELKFRHTVLADIPTIMSFIVEAQKNFAKLGIDQWQDGYPGEVELEEDIRNGEGYVVTNSNGQLLAATMITFSEEPTYKEIEGEWLTDGKPCYGTVHRIVISSEAKRMGVASFIIDQLHLMAKKRQAISLRIDTHRDNQPMLNLIEKSDYTYCGIIYVRGRCERLAYEKILK